jgi:uncharacterized membrane protein
MDIGMTNFLYYFAIYLSAGLVASLIVSPISAYLYGRLNEAGKRLNDIVPVQIGLAVVLVTFFVTAGLDFHGYPHAFYLGAFGVPVICAVVPAVVLIIAMICYGVYEGVRVFNRFLRKLGQRRQARANLTNADRDALKAKLLAALNASTVGERDALLALVVREAKKKGVVKLQQLLPQEPTSDPATAVESLYRQAAAAAASPVARVEVAQTVADGQVAAPSVVNDGQVLVTPISPL